MGRVVRGPIRTVSRVGLTVMTIEQAAEALGRSPLTLREWVAKGDLLHSAVNSEGRRLFDPADVLAAAHEQRRRYNERPFKAGTGRGRKDPRRPLIVRAVTAGDTRTVKQLAADLEVSTALVRKVRRELKQSPTSE